MQQKTHNERTGLAQDAAMGRVRVSRLCGGGDEEHERIGFGFKGS